MRGSALISLARNIGKRYYPIQGTWGGIVPSMEPKKQGNEESGKCKTIADEVTEPIVAFSRPPPHPYFLGPLVALYLLESCSRSDSNDA